MAVEVERTGAVTVMPLAARLKVSTLLVPLPVTSSLLPSARVVMLTPFGPAVSVLLVLPA